MRIIYSILIVVLIHGLSGCMNVATTVPQVVYNRHALKKNINDQVITMRGFQALHYKTDEFKNSNIEITTFNGEVLLAGQAPYVWQKTKAEQIIREIPNVKQIYNLVEIANPSSSLTRISDAWITAKVKAKLIASEDLDATQIKVITENGKVYLMGILPPNEATAAVNLASNTEGVLSVIKIFSYVNISKETPSA